MGYNLPLLARRAGRRRNITLRPIVPTASQAVDLAAIIAPAWQIWQQNIDRILAGSSSLLPQPGRINLTLRRVTRPSG